ncbi:MAG TPA: hypothetical protein VHD87_12960 [Acidimicrobiales bacterium]|nr:hypothetical protein [Acidimicrobiales bacterium]
MSAIYRTVYQVEVLSEGPFVPPELGDNDPFDLLAIHYEITEGACVGKVIEVSSVEIPADHIRDALRAVGNDGELFDPVFPDDEEDQS